MDLMDPCIMEEMYLSAALISKSQIYSDLSQSK